MSDQYNLFDGRPPAVAGSETSREAADSMVPHVNGLQAEVLATIKRSGNHGMTTDEVECALSGRHQTISARVRELALKKLITSNGDKRKTRSGRNALVWRVA